MNTNYLDNNHLVLVGKITSEKRFSHEIYGESFYIFDIEVPRLSGATDIIPVTISERLVPTDELTIGRKVMVEGQFRSYNSYENERNKLVLTVFVKELQFIQESEPKTEEEEKQELKEGISNEVTLIGFICKAPIYRQTPFGREISDILLAVNRAYNKSDYIPAIAWGRNARFCKNIEVGTKVKIVGRVQSRQYEKKYEDGRSETKVAYEVSVASLELINEEEQEKSEEEIG